MDSNDMFSVDNLTSCRSQSKWAPLIIYLLRDGNPQRYAQLKRQISNISQKMLTQTLRQLEEQGLVSRTVYPTVPATVEYALTPQGKRFIEPFLEMAQNAFQSESPKAGK